VVNRYIFLCIECWLWETGTFYRMWWDASWPRSVLNIQILEVVERQPTVSTSSLCSSYRHLPCLCTPYFKIIAVISLLQSVCARVGTTQCMCKTCILSVDFATVGSRSYVYSEGFFQAQIMLQWGWDHQYSQRTCVIRWKSSCSLILPSPVTVLH
jgi:hypothetical protein